MTQAAAAEGAGLHRRLRHALQLPIDEIEADGKPRGELRAVRDDDQNRLLLSAAARTAARRPTRPMRDRDCPSARRTAAAAGGEPARAPARRAASRRPTAAPADASRDATARPDRPAGARARRCRHRPAHERRHEHVLDDAALRQQAVVLEHEADFLVAERREILRRTSRTGSCRRASPSRSSAARARRECREACSCRCPTAP